MDALVQEQETAVVQAVYAAFEAGDLARIGALFAAEGVITQSSGVPWGGVHTGLDTAAMRRALDQPAATGAGSQAASPIASGAAPR